MTERIWDEEAGQYVDLVPKRRVAAPEPAVPVSVPLPPGVVESALVVGPGDTLVIRVRPDTSAYVLREIEHLIEETPLRGRVLLVAAEEIGVVRPTSGLGEVEVVSRDRGPLPYAVDVAEEAR